MNTARACLILGILFLSGACTQGTTELTLLDEDRVPQPKFSGSITKNLQTYNDALTFQINGECDPKISGIKGSAVGTATTFSDLSSMTVSGVSVTCSTDNKFSFELKSLAALGYLATEGAVYEIQLRAETSAGVSKPSYIRILYTSAGGGKAPVLITSGGSVKATDGVISAQVRVTNKMNARALPGAQANSDEASLKTDGIAGGVSAHVGVRANQ